MLKENKNYRKFETKNMALVINLAPDRSGQQSQIVRKYYRCCELELSDSTDPLGNLTFGYQG